MLVILLSMYVTRSRYSLLTCTLGLTTHRSQGRAHPTARYRIQDLSHVCQTRVHMPFRVDGVGTATHHVSRMHQSTVRLVAAGPHECWEYLYCINQVDIY